MPSAAFFLTLVVSTSWALPVKTTLSELIDLSASSESYDLLYVWVQRGQPFGCVSHRAGQRLRFHRLRCDRMDMRS
jgi:hypothetical protein